MNKKYSLVIGGILISVILIWVIFTLTNQGNNLKKNNNDRPRTTPTISKLSPTSNPTPTSEMNGTSDKSLPTTWTKGYDGALNYRFAYPSDWYFYPSYRTSGESAVYSFDIETTPDTGGVPEDELKIAVVYFPSNQTDRVNIDQEDIESETNITIDGNQATRRVMTGMGGGSITTDLTINGGRYLISAYPPQSQLLNIYDKFLQQITFESVPAEIESPELGEVINSPLIVSGEIVGNWFFEGSLPIELYSRYGNRLAQANATSSENWMTTEMIPFSAELEFDNNQSSQGYLKIQKSNPSGLPENDMTFFWPVRFE